jgi:hypothetical protein
MATRLKTPANAETVGFSGDLVNAFAEIEGAAKDKVNPHFKSKYADLTSVIDAIKPVLAKHNLAFYQRPQPSESGILVQTILRHSSGEEVDLGTLYVPANKNDAQGFGSALTYARRYALMTAFGVPAEDDDGNAAARSSPCAAATSNAVPPITDQQRDLIQQLAPGAGKTLQGICEAYRIPSLKELTFAQAEKLIERLRADTKQKENA